MIFRMPALRVLACSRAFTLPRSTLLLLLLLLRAHIYICTRARSCSLAALAPTLAFRAAFPHTHCVRTHRRACVVESPFNLVFLGLHRVYAGRGADAHNTYIHTSCTCTNFQLQLLVFTFAFCFCDTTNPIYAACAFAQL